jgi:putative peptide zinc metalloprotease protein
MTTSPLPRPRSDLLFTPVQENRRTLYIIEDPVRNLFFRVGREEYLLISSLGQADSLPELLEMVAEKSGVTLTPEQAQTIFTWLASRQLLQADNAAPLLGAIAQEKALAKLKSLQRLNLITFKIPLFNPDPLLRHCGFLFWLVGGPFLALWLAAAFLAIATLVSEWPAFIGQSLGFFSTANLLWIWLIWFALKVLHELFHALACYRYGGRVYEAGVLLILFIPLSYVNATSSWRFPSKWQRIHVAVAGMFSELGVAFVALLIWAHSPDSPGGFIAHNTVIIAGVSSLLFNANPLMRFDGYYVLSDLLGIPNLYQQGLHFVKARMASFFLGISDPTPAPRTLIKFYGVAIHIWRLLVLVSLGFLASHLAGGLGIFITFGAVLVWVGLPLATFIKRWPTYRQSNPRLGRHFALRLAGTVLLIAAGMQLIGWEKRVIAPAVVEYQEQFRVRSKASGFVERIAVADGDRVTTGQLLLVLENPDLEQHRHQLELQLGQLAVKMRLAHSARRIPELQILRDQEQTLSRELAAVQRDIADLVITAPGDGICLSDNLADLQGTFLGKGQELLWIVSLQQKQLTGMAAQNDIDRFRQLLDQPLRVEMRAAGLGSFEAKLTRIAPQMTTSLAHPALGATYGGPLDVRQTVIAGPQAELEQQLRYELFAPRFTLQVEIPEEIRGRLHAGQLATLSTGGERVTLGAALKRKVDDWLARRNPATGKS